MIESFKTYINTLLCLGIFVTILQLIVPKNKLRKYIYSLVGIIMIITIISPVVNLLRNENVEDGINQVIANIDEYKLDNSINHESFKEANEDTIKNQMITSLKQDIKIKLNNKNIEVNDIQIYLEDDYTIKKINLEIKNLNNSNISFSDLNSIIKYINEEYEIDYSKIEVIEEGKR